MERQRWQRIQELFEAAVERNDDARLRFLEQSCGDDVDLIDEVMSLVQADEKGRSSSEVPWPAPVLPLERPFRPGDRFKNYRIVSRLAVGGMGMVYKAVDMRLERPVALKFLSGQLTGDPRAKDRFMLEVKTASKLDHPNICTVYEVGSLEEETVFISMAFCEGQTVETLIEDSPLSTDFALCIATQVAAGLQKAHALEIIHRDIKPANIIVSEERVAKIVDFGIAKLPGNHLTDNNSKIGTLAYMSPEQLRGQAVDSRSDLWSLGLVLYETLTGRHPFSGDVPGAPICASCNQDPMPVSHWIPDTPSRLDQIVTRALALDAERRYQTAHSFLNDLYELSDRLGADVGRH